MNPDKSPGHPPGLLFAAHNAYCVTQKIMDLNDGNDSRRRARL